MVSNDLNDAFDLADLADLREWWDLLDLVSKSLGLSSFFTPFGDLAFSLGWGDLYA
jgi:hypothetical protein